MENGKISERVFGDFLSGLKAEQCAGQTGQGFSGYPGTNIGSGHTIIIAANCTMNVSVTTESPITVNALKSMTISGGKTLTSNSVTACIINGNLSNGGIIIFAGGSDCTIGSTGKLVYNGTQASFTGDLTNNGILEVSANKTLEVSGGKLTHNGTQAKIYGTLELSGSADMDVYQVVWETGGRKRTGRVVVDR